MRNMTSSSLSIMRVSLIAIMIAGLCPALMAADGEPDPAPAPYKPPAYSVLRHTEDWSGLGGQNGQEGSDYFDPIKFVPLNEDGTVWASFGAQFRFRTESWDNFNFDAPLTADDSDIFPLARALFHTDLHIKNHVRFFIQGKSAWSAGRDLIGGTRGLDADSIDLQNFFVDVMAPVGDGQWSFRFGRQELLFGKQRLVSPLDWANTRRTFDGFSTALNVHGWKMTAFLTHPVPVRKYSFNKADTKADFFGFYAAGKVASGKVGLDFYWLGLNRPLGSFNGTAGREERQTVGVRAGGKFSGTPFDYDLETAFQFGTVGAGDISALMFASQFGYTFKDMRSSPRVYGGFDYASGDDAIGGDVGTFRHLFPLGHAYMGFIDAVGRQNIIDVTGGAAFKPFKKLLVKVDWHNFWRANTNDGFYNVGGGLSRAGALGVASDVGQELDLTFKVPVNRHTVFVAGYSHFFAGDFIRESGPAEGINFGYLSLQFTF